MNSNDKPHHTLLQQSAKVCCHCEHFMQGSCPKGPNSTDPNFKKFRWSSLSSCSSWEPNPIADNALQIITLRKLEGCDGSALSNNAPMKEYLDQWIKKGK